MATNLAEAKDSLARYIEEVRSAWGDGKGTELPFKVKALMEKLFAETSPDEPWMAKLIREAKSAVELYRDSLHGFIQMGHVHAQDRRNSPHDHGPCWVVYGSYSGITDITTYKRVDDGGDRGKANLAVKEVRRLSPGIAHSYLPGEIHSTHAAQGPAVVFRFLSYDLEKIERYRYDLKTGAVTRA